MLTLSMIMQLNGFNNKGRNDCLGRGYESALITVLKKTSCRQKFRKMSGQSVGCVLPSPLTFMGALP